MNKNATMIQYKCFICNGAEHRCDFEKEVVLVLEKNKRKISIKGKYDGYRRMIINKKYRDQPRKNWEWSDFELKPYLLDSYCSKNNSCYKKLCINIVPEGGGFILNPGVFIYCNSCYNE